MTQYARQPLQTRVDVERLIINDPITFREMLESNADLRQNFATLLQTWNIADINEVAWVFQQDPVRSPLTGVKVVLETGARDFMNWMIKESEMLQNNSFHTLGSFKEYAEEWAYKRQSGYNFARFEEIERRLGESKREREEQERKVKDLNKFFEQQALFALSLDWEMFIKELTERREKIAFDHPDNIWKPLVDSIYLSEDTRKALGLSDETEITVFKLLMAAEDKDQLLSNLKDFLNKNETINDGWVKPAEDDPLYLEKYLARLGRLVALGKISTEQVLSIAPPDLQEKLRQHINCVTNPKNSINELENNSDFKQNASWLVNNANDNVGKANEIVNRQRMEQEMARLEQKKREEERLAAIHKKELPEAEKAQEKVKEMKHNEQAERKEESEYQSMRSRKQDLDKPRFESKKEAESKQIEKESNNKLEDMITSKLHLMNPVSAKQPTAEEKALEHPSVANMER